MALGMNQAGLLAAKCCLETKVPVAQEVDSSDFYSVFRGSGNKSPCTFRVRLLAFATHSQVHSGDGPHLLSTLGRVPLSRQHSHSH